MIFQTVLNFILYLYVTLLSSFFIIITLDSNGLKNNLATTIIVFVIQSPYIYYYLYKDSESYLYGVITEGIVILFPIASLCINSKEFYDILVFSLIFISPLWIIASRRWISGSDTCLILPRFVSWLFCRSPEETLAIIKPDGFYHKNEILNILYDNGFTVLNAKEETLTTYIVARLYSDKIDETYYPELQDHLMSGNVYIMRLSHPRAVSKLKEIVGPADAGMAQNKKKYNNTIRSQFGTDIYQNVIHVSNSKRSAIKEINMFWSTEEMNPLTINSKIDEQQETQQASNEIPEEEKTTTIDKIRKFTKNLQKQVWSEKLLREELDEKIQKTVDWAQEKFQMIEKLFAEEKKIREELYNGRQKSVNISSSEELINWTQESTQAIEKQVAGEAERLKTELTSEIQNTMSWVKENVETIQQELKKTENNLLELEQGFVSCKVNAPNYSGNNTLGVIKSTTTGSSLYTFTLFLSFVIAVFSVWYSHKLKNQNEKLTEDFISLAERYKKLEFIVDSVRKKSGIDDDENNDLNIDD